MKQSTHLHSKTVTVIILLSALQKHIGHCFTTTANGWKFIKIILWTLSSPSGRKFSNTFFELLILFLSFIVMDIITVTSTILTSWNVRFLSLNSPFIDDQQYIKIKSELSDGMHIYTLQWQEQKLQFKILALGPSLKETCHQLLRNKAWWAAEEQCVMLVHHHTFKTHPLNLTILYRASKGNSENIADWIW